MQGIAFSGEAEMESPGPGFDKKISKMESIAPGGSAVFDYRPDAYRAVAGTIVLESDGKPNFERQRRLGKFLADEFLGCFVGRPDTYFDWDMATLGEDLCDRLKETPSSATKNKSHPRLNS
jgi:hypothetical protein